MFFVLVGPPLGGHRGTVEGLYISLRQFFVGEEKPGALACLFCYTNSVDSGSTKQVQEVVFGAGGLRPPCSIGFCLIQNLSCSQARALEGFDPQWCCFHCSILLVTTKALIVSMFWTALDHAFSWGF